MVVKGTLARDFREYESHHTNSLNKLTHVFGIPLILLALLGLLQRVPLPLAGLNLAILLAAAALIFYLWLDWRLALMAAVALALGYWLATMISTLVLWGAFVVGWILQFVGHSLFEKKSPAFLNNLRHLLIGPLWLMSHLLPISYEEPG